MVGEPTIEEEFSVSEVENLKLKHLAEWHIERVSNYNSSRPESDHWSFRSPDPIEAN